MAEIQAQSISNQAGTGPIDLEYQAAAKAWVNYTHATTTVNDSFNVSSVSDVSTGVYTVNYTASMVSSIYAVDGFSAGNSYGSFVSGTSSGVSRRTWGYGGTTLTDVTSSTSVTGDLA